MVISGCCQAPSLPHLQAVDLHQPQADRVWEAVLHIPQVGHGAGHGGLDLLNWMMGDVRWGVSALNLAWAHAFHTD
jgi:hypothetical protein